MPLSTSVMINQAEVLDLLERGHRAPPRGAPLGQVAAEAARGVPRPEPGARPTRSSRPPGQRADQMVQQTEVVKAAEARARSVVDAAEAESRRLKLEAEDFCDQRLASFEIVLERTMKVVSAGRAKLQGSQAAQDERDLGDAPEGGHVHTAEDEQAVQERRARRRLEAVPDSGGGSSTRTTARWPSPSSCGSAICSGSPGAAGSSTSSSRPSASRPRRPAPSPAPRSPSPAPSSPCPTGSRSSAPSASTGTARAAAASRTSPATPTSALREIAQRVPIDDEIYPIDEDLLDLQPMVHELVLASLPLAPLCAEDCSGPDPERFPTTTEDEAAAAAAAEAPPPDPRWAALSELRLGED